MGQPYDGHHDGAGDGQGAKGIEISELRRLLQELTVEHRRGLVRGAGRCRARVLEGLRNPAGGRRVSRVVRRDAAR